jgi:hypothetical protein
LIWVLTLRSLHSEEGEEIPLVEAPERSRAVACLTQGSIGELRAGCRTWSKTLDAKLYRTIVSRKFRRIRRPTLPKGNVTEKPRGDSLRVVQDFDADIIQIVRRLLNKDQLEKQKDNPNVRRKIEISFKPSNNVSFAMQYVSTYFPLFVMSVWSSY